MISIEKDKYKLLKKIKDPKFNIDNIDRYYLSIQLGVRDFQVFILDGADRRALLLEDYIFEETNNIDALIEILKRAFDNHHLLLAGFWKSVSVIFKNRKFALVPEIFFSRDNAVQLLSLNHQVNKNTTSILSLHHQKASFVNVFGAEKKLIDFFNNIYKTKKVKYMHQSSPVINGSLKVTDNNFLVYIDRFNLHISVIQNGSLLFYNQFLIKKIEDYTRYIKLVAADLKIDLSNTEILLYGFLGKNTPQFKYLEKNVQNIKLGGRPKGIKFGYVFDEIADHQYFDIYSLYSIAG